MDLSRLPDSPNIDDRRNSIVDHLLTTMRYPLRSQRWEPESLNNKFVPPAIAADFPSAPAGYAEVSPLSMQAGYGEISPQVQNIAQILLGQQTPQQPQLGGILGTRP